MIQLLKTNKETSNPCLVDCKLSILDIGYCAFCFCISLPQPSQSELALASTYSKGPLDGGGVFGFSSYDPVDCDLFIL
jgi:hypothetical protein